MIMSFKINLLHISRSLVSKKKAIEVIVLDRLILLYTIRVNFFVNDWPYTSILHSVRDLQSDFINSLANRRGGYQISQTTTTSGGSSSSGSASAGGSVSGSISGGLSGASGSGGASGE